jgi:hypothetical protein
VLRGVREAHCGGLTALVPGIAPVERELERLGPDAIVTERTTEVVEQRAVVVGSDCRRLPTAVGTLVLRTLRTAHVADVEPGDRGSTAR